MTDREKHEPHLVRSFILPARQARYLELLSRPKRRKDVTALLARFKHLDMRFAAHFPPSQHSAAQLLQILRSKGAPDTCYVISESSDIDGLTIPLSDAMTHIHGRGIGTFLSCVPGKLAYFEDEDERWILEHP